MLFWIVAGGLTLAVGALLVRALLRPAAGTATAAAYDLQVYRDQLKEVDRDLARGTLTEAEAERVRVEVSRRLLEADRAGAAGGRSTDAPQVATLTAAALIAAAVVGGSLLLYTRIGAPGFPDLPLETRIEAADAARANRPSQATAEIEAGNTLPAPVEAAPEYLELMERLRSVVAERPDDVQGLRLLARNEARLGDYRAAYAAQQMLVAALGNDATGADHADLADLLILAAGGYVSPEAEAALTEALRRDPRNGPARYYTGLLYAQTGRPDLAFRMWYTLLEESRPQAPWVPPIEAQIEQMARLAGVRYSPPAQPEAPGRGPSAADIEAAADMTAEDRNDMIRNMVAGLAERLAAEGGPAEDWARLIGAYGVLGETERAQAIWAEARTVFADVPQALATIRSAAERAGLAE